MTTTMSAEAIENMMLRITQEIRVRASLDVTFDALLEQLGPLSERPDGTSMQMKLEPWPGGRWFRDLGGNDGHYWATVQAIKRNTLLEMRGPLMMSQPVVNHVIYRLTDEGGETIIKFAHTAFGPIQPEHREGVTKGWSHIHEKVRERAERK
ncbi:MAG: SRPBCC domain-containing protein [Terracidiphilus sp.]